MKKLLATFLILLPLTAFAGDFGLKEPQWADFCPEAYVNVRAPKGIAKLNIVVDYWYQRRVDFEKGLEACRAVETAEDQFSCYEALKVEQYKENSDYNARLEARRDAALGVQEMQNRTDTMIPINNYINTFTKFQPNEMN